MRTPTPKQMSLLAGIPVGTAVMNPRRHDFRPLLNHGWVEPVWDGLAANNHGWNFDGTNTLADARWWGEARPERVEVAA